MVSLISGAGFLGYASGRKFNFFALYWIPGKLSNGLKL